MGLTVLRSSGSRTEALGLALDPLRRELKPLPMMLALDRDTRTER